MQFLKKLAFYAVVTIAMLAIGAAASEPPSWINFAGVAVFGIIAYLVNRYDHGGEDDPDEDAEENDGAPEAPAPHQEVDGSTHWVQCIIHEDDSLPEGVHRLPEPT